jgi:putative ABC transport system permease protein
MTLRDFRIAWRLLLREPGHSAVAIFGLAAAFAACFLLLGYVRHSLGYDSHVPDHERVVAIKQRVNWLPRPEWQLMAYYPLRRAAADSGMVEASTIVQNLETPLRVGRALHTLDVRAVDPAFGAIFGVRTREGDLNAALARPDGLALTYSAAQRLFGGKPALGQRVDAGGAALQVLAIIADPPDATTLPYAALVSAASSAWPAASRQDLDTSYNRRGGVYLKLKRAADMRALAQQLQRHAEQSAQQREIRDGVLGSSLGGRNVTDITLIPLRSVYFDEDLANSRVGAQHGRRGTMLALCGVAALILLLAASNYINLAAIRTVRRQREIAMRKLLGTGPARLAAQLLAESTLVALLAALCGMVLAWLLLPAFGALVARPLNGAANVGNAVPALLLAVATGLCAGIYPAWIAIGVRPATALAGRGDTETAGGLWLRRSLTVLQFSVAMGLTGTAIAIAWQAHFAATMWRGFDPANLHVLDLPASSGTPQGAGLVAAVRGLPGVTEVTGLSEAVGRDGNKVTGATRGRGGRAVQLEFKIVSPEFFQVYGIKPRHGRLFDPARDRIPGSRGDTDESAPSRVAVLNAAAALALGFDTPEAAVEQPLGHRQCIGIAPDIRFSSLRQGMQPVIYVLGNTQVLTIRSSDNAAALQARIQPLWERYFPDDVLDVRSVAGWFGAAYDEDLRMARLLGAASAIATALAASGIYVLSAYSVQRRRREIVLRKLHGAGRAAIARLVGGEFAVLLGAGALFGLPPAAVAIHRHLAGFVEHAPLGVWPLAGALVLAVLVALAATAQHTVVALRMSPASALRG